MFSSCHITWFPGSLQHSSLRRFLCLCMLLLVSQFVASSSVLYILQSQCFIFSYYKKTIWDIKIRRNIYGNKDTNILYNKSNLCMYLLMGKFNIYAWNTQCCFPMVNLAVELRSCRTATVWPGSTNTTISVTFFTTLQLSTV